MNNTICILLIILLLLYISHTNESNPYTIIEGNKKKKKKEKKKAKKAAQVLTGEKSSCEINENDTYTYTAHIKTPSKLKMGKQGSKVNKNLSGISAYADILTKGKSKATKKKKVLGGAYFTKNTQVSKCIDAEGCSRTPMCYQNSIPTDKSVQGLIPGLIDDLNILNGMNSSLGAQTSVPCSIDYDDNNQIPGCTEVVLNYASDNCVGYGKAYLLNSDINNLADTNSGVFYKDQINIYQDANGSTPPNLTTLYAKTDEKQCEAFVPMNSPPTRDPALDYKKFHSEMHKNDPIKQAFILIVGLGGIYCLQKLMLK